MGLHSSRLPQTPPSYWQTINSLDDCLKRNRDLQAALNQKELDLQNVLLTKKQDERDLLLSTYTNKDRQLHDLVLKAKQVERNKLLAKFNS